MRILVVEDDPSLSNVLVRGLRELAFAVDHAADGEQADYLGAINPYDAVVLDLALPKKDGLEVCRALRKRGSETRILMLTARDAVHDRIVGLNAGADDYLVKPFDFEELVARLRALTRRKGEVRERRLVVSDLELDTHAHRAQRAGVPLALTNKEYALLEFLVLNVNRVMGRREISEHVWDDNYDPASNVIDSYINRLRRKVDREGHVPLIHTRRGAGYLVSDEAATR
jgi:two-component system copper resistance phosphate regulon response regulator CusR